jgi:hypothetical protein
MLMSIGAASTAELASVMAAATASLVRRVVNMSKPPMAFMKFLMAPASARWLPWVSAEFVPRLYFFYSPTICPESVLGDRNWNYFCAGVT